MSTEGQTTDEGGGRKAAPYRRPYWLGALVSAMGALWLYNAYFLPQGARYAAIGPGLFVTIAGGGLLILGIILMVQIHRGERFEPQDAEDAAADAPMDRNAFFIALLAVVLPIIIMRPFGLPITAMIAFTLVCRAFGSRAWVANIITGAIIGSLAWFLFSRLGLQLGPFFGQRSNTLFAFLGF
ncbi:MAG: tripartite tricarboxylate transporter TctB family protein [Devosia sp.]